MKSLRRMIAAVLVCAFAASPALALGLGDPAPQLKIKEWVKGEAVELAKLKGKKVVVIEFWATWCRPCRDSIPHLTKLQKEYKDVVIVSISCEEPNAVKPFVKKQGDKMGYTIAIDDKRATDEAYNKPFGINFIPFSFIIDKQGRIAWAGSPMELDKPLKQIVEGAYDLEAAIKAIEAGKLAENYFKLVAKGGEENLKQAKELGEKIYQDGKHAAGLMNEFAWTILMHPMIPETNRDLKLAKKAAKAAYKESEKKDPAIIDTYARALWMNGKKSKAIKLQKKAVKLATDPQTKAGLQKVLDEYLAEAPKDKDGKKKKGKKNKKQDD